MLPPARSGDTGQTGDVPKPDAGVGRMVGTVRAGDPGSVVNRSESRPAERLPARPLPDPPASDPSAPMWHPARHCRAAARVAVRAARNLAYLVASLPVALAGFTLVAVGLPVGAALTPVLVGLVVLIGLSTVVDALGRGQIRLAGALLGPPPASGGTPAGAHAVGGRRGRLGDRRTWRAFAWFLLAPVVTVVPVVVAVLLAAVVGRGLAYPVTEWGVDLSTSWGGPTWIGAVALHTGAGVGSLLAAPPVLRLFARGHAALVRRLLPPDG